MQAYSFTETSGCWIGAKIEYSGRLVLNELLFQLQMRAAKRSSRGWPTQIRDETYGEASGGLDSGMQLRKQPNLGSDEARSATTPHCRRDDYFFVIMYLARVIFTPTLH